MTPRRRALLIVGLGLVLIGIIVFAIVMLVRSLVKPQASVSPSAGASDVFEPGPAEVDFVNPLIVETPYVPANTFSRTIAELFAARYGSYSNQGDYQNIRDLLRVMTPRYRQESEEFLRTATTVPGATFEGVTSKKISTQFRSIDDDKAVIAVSMQQEKTVGTAAPTISYRTLRMELLNLGGDWWVDSATWEN